MLATHLLSSILATPLLGAGLLLLAGRGRPGAIRAVALASALVSLVLVVPFWMRYDPAGPPFQMREQVLLVRSLGSGYDVGADGLTLLFVLSIGLVSLLAVVISWARIGDRQRSHYVRLLVLQAATTGVVVALDALLFAVCWLVMLVAAGALVPAERIGRWRIASGAIASLVMLLTASVLVSLEARGVTGSATLDLTRLQQVSLPAAQQSGPFLILLTGAAVPWLLLLGRPPGPSDPGRARVAAVVTYGVLVFLPIYALVRFNLAILPQASRTFVPLLAGVALAMIWLAAIQALRARGWTGVVSCAAAGQAGLTLLGLAVIDPAALAGSLIHPMGVGLAVAPLLAWMAVPERAGDPGPPPTRGMSVAAPLLLAVLGIPGPWGSAGSSAILRGAWHSHPLWALAAGGGLIMLAAAIARQTWRATRRAGVAAPSVGGGLGEAQLTGLLAFVLITGAIGLAPGPIRERLQPTMARVITRLDPGYAPAFSHVPGCGSAGPAPAAPAGFTAIAPCDTAPSPPK